MRLRISVSIVVRSWGEVKRFSHTTKTPTGTVDKALMIYGGHDLLFRNALQQRGAWGIKFVWENVGVSIRRGRRPS